jgi:hypothetical protein
MIFEVATSIRIPVLFPPLEKGGRGDSLLLLLLPRFLPQRLL